MKLFTFVKNFYKHQNIFFFFNLNVNNGLSTATIDRLKNTNILVLSSF